MSLRTDEVALMCQALDDEEQRFSAMVYVLYEHGCRDDGLERRLATIRNLKFKLKYGEDDG